MKIEIPGNPIPQKRTRSKVFPGMKHAIHYDSQAGDKQNVQWMLKKEKELNNLTCTETLKVNITFHIPYPKKLNTSEINAVEWGFDDHVAKPDLDNLAKFYLDCMNGIVYKDDCQIKNLFLKKRYSKNPRTVIEIKEMKKNYMNTLDKKIISNFSPTELIEFLEDTKNLIEEYEKYDEIKESNYEDSAIFREILSTTSAFLVGFSNKYAKILTKINKLAEKEGEDD